MLGSLGPINRDLERLNTKVAERDENLSSLVHNLSVSTKSVGTQDQDVMRLVTASNDTLEAIASEDPDIQTAVSLLPGALEDTRDALAAAKGFGDELGPAFNSLRPFARNLPELNASTTELAETVTPIIRDQIRPFVRAAREPIPDLNRAAKKYSKAAPQLEGDRVEAQHPGEHGGLQPARQGSRRHRRPRRGLPLLGRRGWPTTERASIRSRTATASTAASTSRPAPAPSRTSSTAPSRATTRSTDLGISIITGIPLDLADCT